MVNSRLLPDQGGDSLARCRGTPITVAANALAVVRACCSLFSWLQGGVYRRWLVVTFAVLVTASAVGDTARDIDGMCAAGGDGWHGGSSTSIIPGIGVFCRIYCWCMRGVVLRTRGHIGLLDGVRPTATLGVGAAATFDDVAPSTLCGSALSTLGGGGNSSL